MAKVTFGPDREVPPLDRALEDQAQAAAMLGKPIRLRLQPDIYDHTKAAYQVWAGLAWTIEVGDVEEGRRLRECLTALFRVYGAGMDRQARLLAALEDLQDQQEGEREGRADA